jgi:hypothetical protein
VDAATQDEYWVLQNVPSWRGELRVLRKQHSAAEIVLAALAAGAVVESAAATVYRPFEKLRDSSKAEGGEPGSRLSLLGGVYDGFVPLALTTPGPSMFWATRDISRMVLTKIMHDGSATSTPFVNCFIVAHSTALAEITVWAARTPDHVRQARGAHKMQVAEDISEEGSDAALGRAEDAIQDVREVVEESLKALPVLAMADVPHLSLRALVFTSVHEQSWFQSGVAEDAMLFVLANIVAVVATTPLDVLRTQMLLQGRAITELPEVAEGIYKEDGPLAFLTGLAPRLLWNGVALGASWCLVRQGYDGLRDTILTHVINRVADLDLAEVLRTAEHLYLQSMPHVLAPLHQ